MSDILDENLDGELSTFSSFNISDDDTESLVDQKEDLALPVGTVDSPFTILIDSREQQPYTFSNIKGDFRNDYSPIRVRTLKKSLPVGDYRLSGVSGCIIERKSLPDLFGSFADTSHRENFLERLRKIQAGYEFGVVMVEAYPTEILSNPPVHTSLNPKTILRSIFSWSIQFPLVHWFFGENREMAEQMTYRILEKFYQHKIELKYKHHNKPIDANIEAFRQGQLARMTSNESEIAYCHGNPLRVSWLRGYGFATTHLYGGDLGQLYEAGSLPTTSAKEKTKLKNEEKKFKPLPGQKELVFNNIEEEARHWIGNQFDLSIKRKKV